MKKPKAILAMSVLTASLIIPIGASADPNPPGNARERQELREDMQRLERLRQQRAREVRQRDWRDVREYNEKIRDTQREIRQDQREIYGYNDRGWYRDWNGRWYRDRWHHDYD